MSHYQPIYVFGCGAVGLSLAAILDRAGRRVFAIRTSHAEFAPRKIDITLHTNAPSPLKASVEMLPLSSVAKLEGTIVIAAKSYANKTLADALAQKSVHGPLVILQNGFGVETPYLEKSFRQIYRCVLYMTAQKNAENELTFRAIAPSPIGIIKGEPADLEACVGQLTTAVFPFRSENDVRREVWKKGIINSVFNSICPLLNVDNGIFVREPQVANLAREIVGECLALANAQGIHLTEAELMEQIRRISQASNGVNISTLQDLQHGRETEIQSLNLEVARMASSAQPPICLPVTEFLGKMILAKSAFR